MGGIIEFTEYALAQVLLPEKYRARFQGRAELLLAFDYEVAEENPTAEFVTFGSDVLETLLDIAMVTATSDVRYAIVDRIEVTSPEERIQRLLGQTERHDINVLSKRVVMGIWAAFTFRAQFISSESFEEERKVWVNMQTGKPDPVMANCLIFFERQPLHEYPYAATGSFSDAYTAAAAEMAAISAGIAESAVSPVKIIRETERLQSYYEDLLEENDRRLTRKGLTSERQEDINNKRLALQQEMERQINEIKANMIPSYNIHLAHGITTHIPVIELTCKITTRNSSEQYTYHYECLTKQLYRLTC